MYMYVYMYAILQYNINGAANPRAENLGLRRALISKAASISNAGETSIRTLFHILQYTISHPTIHYFTS